MEAKRLMLDVTSDLLAGFSPYLHRVCFDFSANFIEFELMDQIEQPSRLRALRFERLRDLQITPHDANDVDPEFTDSIIGVSRSGNEFHFHTERYSISFTCGGFEEENREA